MEGVPFEKQVEIVYDHLANLRRRLDSISEPERQALLVEAVEACSVAFEELHVASEDLHQQNEELAIVRQHIEAERQRYLELFEFAPEAYFVTGPDGTVREANRAASALLSVPQGFLIGKPLSIFVDEKDLESFRSQLNRLAGLGCLEDWEIGLRPRDGETFPAAITIGTMRDSNGDLIGLRWLIHDTTERKRMEEQLRKSESRSRVHSERLLAVHEDERKRVAQDLHDSLGAALAAVKFNIEGVIHHLRDKRVAEEMAASLKDALVSIQNTIEDVRRIYMDLRPSILDDLGILPAMNWFTREFQNEYPPISVEKEIALEEHEVPERLKIILYRVMQEAFSNIAKHSKADQIRLSLGRKGDRVEMVIRDNGRGFDAEEALRADNPGGGLGLSGMGERVRLSGGSLKIESSKETGTVIRASWPMYQP